MQDGSTPSGDQGVAVVDAATTAYLDLTGILDPAKEAAKLEKQQKEVCRSSSAPCCSIDTSEVTSMHQHLWGYCQAVVLAHMS